MYIASLGLVNYDEVYIIGYCQQDNFYSCDAMIANVYEDYNFKIWVDGPTIKVKVHNIMGIVVFPYENDNFPKWYAPFHYF